ncbi:MAG: AI-2E family transporter [Eubacteriales bacterium]|nr:AI-2E family transporter [Eubacteriales bacterium]
MKEKNRYLKWGLTLFLTVCAILVFYDTFYMSGALQHFVSKLMGILAPVVYGFVIAYLLTPVVNWLETAIVKAWHKNKVLQHKKPKRAAGLLRAVSILITEALVIFLIYLLMSVLIPQLVDSVSMLINNAESYYNTIYDWANELINRDFGFGAWVAKLVTDNYDSAITFLQNKILPWAQSMLTDLTGGIWSGIWGVVTFAKNLIIGIIISIYLLAMKEKSLARCCKMVYGIFNENQAKWVVRGTRRVNTIFSGFVRGKLLDSLIIGILCFIGCSILRIPYTPLVSVVVGVTNIIPFFGPFLGAIPSALLILLVSPLKCLYFIIFVALLQQLDGNVIGPKILGGATGISSFWVVVAILVGGGFGGVLGMFLGVPIFACLQVLVKFLIDRRLTKRHMPLEACEYVEREREETSQKEEITK